jgi:DNA helicase-2/ATP-dependent DNA helicase PcrA
VSPHEIVILYRDNKDCLDISTYLKKSDVPFVIESDENIFTHKIVQRLLVIAKAVNSYGDDRALSDYLHLSLWNIVPLDLYKLIKTASQKRKYSLYDVISNTKLLNEVELENVEAVTKSFSLLTDFIKQAHDGSISDFFEYVFRESGLLEKILQGSDARLMLDVVDSFFDEVRSFVGTNPKGNLADFLAYLTMLETHHIVPKKKNKGGKEGFVRLMTAHRSKGLEFEYVFIIHVHDGKWGNKRKVESLKLLPEVYSLVGKSNSSDSLHDERRLLYVALTRAKKHVTISFSRQGEDGREQLPSQFIQEIDPKLLSLIDTAPFEAEFEIVRPVLYEVKGVSQNISFKDKAYVRDLFTTQGMSVSALNNYLSCPWKYFYRNLIRLPQADEAHLMYGTAIHEALNTLFNKLRIDEKFSKKDFIKSFVIALESQPFQESDFTVYKERGEKALGGWFDEYSSRWITQTQNEFAIRQVALTPDIILTGKLDKIEFISESEVNVVDYKTGKPKTRNQITGDTKDSEGNIFRQLVFYKILLDRFKDGAYEMISGEIDFIEPNQTEKYSKEKFIVTPEDTEELIETIKRVGDEILNLSFWDKRCDDKECEYCRLREMIKE